MGAWFPANMVLNAGWIFAWHYQFVGLSVLI
ncbi:MAG: tryptophan-rich sensory protein, partial [Spirochaetaceae bacterium]